MSLIVTTTTEPAGDDASVLSVDATPALPPDMTERSIPLRVSDLERLLRSDSGLSAEERNLWNQFTRVLGATFHHKFHECLIELKEKYVPLDPDSDCIDLEGLTLEPSEDADEAFLAAFEEVLMRANYRPLNLEIIEQAITAPNEHGLNYVPDLELFEHLKVYARGATKVVRKFRSLRTAFRRKEITFDGYERLVIALKFRPNDKLGEYVQSDVLYLRMFKDVPHVDMEMHLPEQGVKVKMRWIDKAQIASPIAMGLPTLALKLMAASIFTLPLTALGGLLAAPIGAGVKSFFGFQQTKLKHLHHMIRHLYYLTLANNASVINRLVDSAEEEEIKESLLAYFILWRGANDENPWDLARLDQACEALLKDRAGVTVNFEIGDAVDKLLRLGLARTDPRGNLHAVPILEGLAHLDKLWDDWFHAPKEC